MLEVCEKTLTNAGFSELHKDKVSSPRISKILSRLAHIGPGE